MSQTQDLPKPPEDATDREKQLWKELINRMLGHQQTESMAEALQAFDDGATVQTPDGFGIIDDIVTEGTVDGMDASDDEPVYAVVVEDEDVGVGFYREDELSEGSVDDLPGPENPEEELEALADIHDATDDAEALQDGFFEWPESWEDSPQPARVIGLKAWASMGGSFRGCRREMRGNISRPNAFCADYKDRLYGTDLWRGGWAD